MIMNSAQPASRMLRFRPLLAATLVPGCSTVPRAEAVMPFIRRASSATASQASTKARAVLWWKSRRLLRTLRHSLASARRSRLRLPEPGRAPGLRRCRAVIVVWPASRKRGPVLANFDPPDCLEAGVRPAATTGGLPLGAVPGDEQDLIEAMVRLEPRVPDPSLLELLALLPNLLPTLFGVPDA